MQRSPGGARADHETWSGIPEAYRRPRVRLLTISANHSEVHFLESQIKIW